MNVAVEATLARGVRFIAITANQSPLAKQATVTISLDQSARMVSNRIE